MCGLHRGLFTNVECSIACVLCTCIGICAESTRIKPAACHPLCYSMQGKQPRQKGHQTPNQKPTQHCLTSSPTGSPAVSEPTALGGICTNGDGDQANLQQPLQLTKGLCEELRRPLCVVRKAEHCSGRPISLCGFHARLSESSHPFMRWRCSGLSSAAAPQHPSTCIHTLCFLQMAAISSKGSNAPSTVVPAVVPTKNGTCAAHNFKIPV